MKNKIAFITAIIPKYKVWLYEELGKKYGERFFAIHGKEMVNTVPKDIEEIDVKNNIRLKTKYFFFKSTEIIWIPVIFWILKNRPQVIILQDGVRILSNFITHFFSQLYGGKVFYYSHGHNHQASFTRSENSARLTEKIRRFSLRKADGIFVYTKTGMNFLRDHNISTPVYNTNNTLDTHRILKNYDNIQIDNEYLKALNIDRGSSIITFLGRLVKEKNVDKFIDIIKIINEQSDIKIHGLIIGDGPLKEKLTKQAENLPITFAGYQSGVELYKKISLSDIIFLPGMVGLAIIEAFCAGKPLVTINHSYHSPEIEYLIHNENGLLINESTSEQEAKEISSLLSDKNKLRQMSVNAKKTVLERCSSDIMLNSFIDGIEDALANHIGKHAQFTGRKV